MLRTTLVAAAVLAVTVPVARPADKAQLPDGNWLLVTVGPAGESAVCVLNTKTANGKSSVSVVATPPMVETTVSDVKATDTGLAFTLKEVRPFKTRTGEDKFTTERKFVAASGTDPKVILGSLGTDQFPIRAKLTATDKDTIGEFFVRGPAADVWQKVQQAAMRPATLQNQARQEKDAEKKKGLLAKVAEARKEADEKLPGLYRDVVEKHPDIPAALDAALALVRSAAKAKVTPAEAAALAELVGKQAARYGPRYARTTAVNLADDLVREKELAGAALGPIGPVARGLTDKDPLIFQFNVLSTYKAALEGAGKTGEAKAVDARLAKLDAALDEEYLATVPPFKPAAFAGRKDKAANRVAVMELFTGAQCPPCVAADVAFDALAKSYKPTDLIVLQYHMHIPGPDPLTNPDTVGRWDYYLEAFPEDVRGTPTTLFNGKPQAGGGGGMTMSEDKFGEYRKLVDPLLEKTTPVTLDGTATRRGDKIEIAVGVDGAPAGDDLRLRLLLVEDTIKYAGGNRLRFHHHVVRAMPGGAAGVAVKDKTMRHTATADVGAVRDGLVKYLDEYAKNERPFPYPARPLEMKNLKVIALVQNDKTSEILQAVQIEVEDKTAGGK
ncbi:MAG: hypothetical protein JWO38_7363 [Gemmataceae bacterium]|nr:hypothetical protein [Gemmataceae bacterium]